VPPPHTIFTASSTDIDLAALTRKARACGTAISAARFIAVTSSSTFFWPPVAFSSLAAPFRTPGGADRAHHQRAGAQHPGRKLSAPQ
jgi:hypothetical protein